LGAAACHRLEYETGARPEVTRLTQFFGTVVIPHATSAGVCELRLFLSREGVVLGRRSGGLLVRFEVRGDASGFLLKGLDIANAASSIRHVGYR